MPSDDIIQGITPSQKSAKAQQMQEMQRSERQLAARRSEARSAMSERTEEAAFNPLKISKDFRSLDQRMRARERADGKKSEFEDTEVKIVDATSEAASEFENQNPELKRDNLLKLKVFIYDSDSAQEILDKIMKAYPDEFLADETLNFLLQTTDPKDKLYKTLLEAKKLLNDKYEREIKAGRNINTEAREFSKRGLGSPKALRDLYRDVTGNPRDARTLFDELKNQFNFDKMKNVLQFFLHSLGKDLKSKGPSISMAELQLLFSETRTMQAILGVFKFFMARMQQIEGQFSRGGLVLPPQINFETVAQAFVSFVTMRYPSPDKVFSLAGKLGISEELLAQIIIFTQFRDGMRNVSPRFFLSEKHRQDLLLVLLDAISELDEILEEEEEEEEEDEEDEEAPRSTGWNTKDTME